MVRRGCNCQSRRASSDAKSTRMIYANFMLARVKGRWAPGGKSLPWLKLLEDSHASYVDIPRGKLIVHLEMTDWKSEK